MDLYEHQARALFEEHGIPVPRAEVTASPQEARAIARGLGGSVVVKAQVKTGGRGKAGGVRRAADPAEAERAARRILGMDIKGHTVGKVMLAQPVDIGGGASAQVMADGLGVILSDPAVRSVFVNVFGGITACDAVAAGIVRALDEVRLTKPLVVRLDGNNAARGRAVLDEHAHPLVEQATTMDGAARRAAELADAS